MRNLRKVNKKEGYVAITVVIVLAAVVLGIMVAVAQLGIGEGQSSLALSKGEDTLAFVEGCMEDALLKIHNSASYSGGNITRPEGTCTISISQAGSTYTITSTANATDYARTIVAVVNRSSTLTITSWREE
jgi:hypothetical protein